MISGANDETSNKRSTDHHRVVSSDPLSCVSRAAYYQKKRSRKSYPDGVQGYYSEAAIQKIACNYPVRSGICFVVDTLQIALQSSCLSSLHLSTSKIVIHYYAVRVGKVAQM